MTGALSNGTAVGVLVMDDEVRVPEVTSHILMGLGHEVERARDGAEALEKFRGAIQEGNGSDIIILDLNVPHGMGGRGAIKEILPSTRGRRSLSPPVIPVTLS